MKFYTLSPEVAGYLGRNTVMSRHQHPPIVSKLHFEFAGWLGDDLLESFPCFVVTKRLAELLENKGLSGYELKDLEVSLSDEFRELYPGRELPPFRWLDVKGKAGIDDIGLDKNARLVVSQDVLDLLQSIHLSNCDVAIFKK